MCHSFISAIHSFQLFIHFIHCYSFLPLPPFRPSSSAIILRPSTSLPPFLHLRNHRLHESILHHLPKHLREARRVANIPYIPIHIPPQHLKVKNPLVRVVHVRQAPRPFRLPRLRPQQTNYLRPQNLRRRCPRIIDRVRQELIEADDRSRSRSDRSRYRSTRKQHLWNTRTRRQRNNDRSGAAGDGVDGVLGNVADVAAEVDDIDLVHGRVLEVVVEGGDVGRRGLDTADDLAIDAILHLPPHHREVQAGVDDAHDGTDDGEEPVEWREWLAHLVADQGVGAGDDGPLGFEGVAGPEAGEVLGGALLLEGGEEGGVEDWRMLVWMQERMQERREKDAGYRKRQDTGCTRICIADALSSALCTRTLDLDLQMHSHLHSGTRTLDLHLHLQMHLHSALWICIADAECSGVQ